MKNILIAVALLLGAVPVITAQETPEVIHLWTNGAPGFESRKDEPELAKDYWIRNINNPSITLFLPPREIANGAAVVICPGGGFRELVFNSEGVEPAKFFNKLGVAAFVLKYRLVRETNSPYSINIHPLEDGQRAMRLVRSRAMEWNLDPHRIGIVGFSAGGEVASLVSYANFDGNPSSTDTVEKTSAKADFQISIYPGPLGVPATLTTNAPPSFFLAADDDRFHSKVITDLLEKFRAVKVPAEVHLYAKGGHGFNMGYRSKLISIKGWPDLMANWMADNQILSTNLVDTTKTRAK